MKCVLSLASILLLLPTSAVAQSEAARMEETGHVVYAGRTTPYRIRRLPVSAFPDLPRSTALELERRGCWIPQSWQAHHPENVVRAALERSSSQDWAVLCSADGNVSLLVFFASAPEHAQVLATAREADRLELRETNGTLEFAWGIDPASPEQVREAQSGLAHKAPRSNHDALADMRIDRQTQYHYFTGGAWTLLELPEE